MGALGGGLYDSDFALDLTGTIQSVPRVAIRRRGPCRHSRLKGAVGADTLNKADIFLRFAHDP